MAECSNEVFGKFEDIDITHLSDEEDEKSFTRAIGCIEDTIMDVKFLDLHSKFLEEHWREFDDTEENKFIYMDIFKEYNKKIEKYIVDRLIKTVPGFDLCKFEHELQARQNELNGEIFEILSTFTDFLAFKTMFLDHKAMKEGKVADFSKDFCVSKLKVGDE